MVDLVGKCIAIIPARGGSKRIVDKNIIDFSGKPMIAWTIEAAKSSKLFDRVLVSTDDERIAAVARTWGAEVPFLRSEFSDDYSTVSLATASALKQAQEYWSEDYETVVQLMANCPMRNCKDIETALQKFRHGNRIFQISCFGYGWMNPWWAVKLDDNNRPDKLFPQALESRSQDLPPLYCPTGAIWIANVERLLSEMNFYGKGHVFEPMEWDHAIDIDDDQDLKMATLISKAALHELSD